MSVRIANGLSTIGAKKITDWIPTNISNCILWLRADKGTTIATGVSQWNDRSGQGNNVTQATGSKQPTLNASDSNYNYQSTLSFVSSGGQFLSMSTLASLSQPFTILLVGQSTSSGAQQQMVSGNVAVNDTTVYWDGTQYNVYNGSASFFQSGNHVRSKQCFAAVFNGASSVFYINNSQAPTNSGALGTGIFGTILAIGAASDGSSPLNGTIAEVLIYSSVLSVSNVQQIFAYFGSRYAISVS